MPKKPTIQQVEEALTSIKPYLAADGGDLRVVNIDANNVVHIQLLGNCESCPMSPMTLKAGIEEAVRKAYPEIKSVMAVNVETHTEHVDSTVES